MTRVFSGVQPSGSLHIGNYLGAVRQWARDQYTDDSLFCIVDLHALTIEHDPAQLRDRTIETMAGLCAAGLDPDVCTLFVQSHVHEHSELSWLLECTATYGELLRMTQFKEKAEGRESVRVGLLTYPVLMAADILLYDTDRVPVGDDQRQHIELTRDVALRFNSRYGETFVVPEGTVPRTAARVMDLQDPRRKMSKSVDSPLGTVAMLDSPEELRRKIRKAVTDTDGEMRYDREAKPGLANLLEMFGAVTDRTPQDVAATYERYGPLKDDLAEALAEDLRSVRERHAELVADPGSLTEALTKGAAKAQSLAAPTLERARASVGLLAL
jgi:tryptophanyl-tRNA synthetase